MNSDRLKKYNYIPKEPINEQHNRERIDSYNTYSGYLTLGRAFRKHRWRRIPSHSCTPTIPNIKKTKKHRSSTLPSIGRVSSKSITSIRIPVERRRRRRLEKRRKKVTKNMAKTATLKSFFFFFSFSAVITSLGFDRNWINKGFFYLRR